MSKHIIIDGYNAMHKLSLCEDNNLKAGRERLAAFINKHKLAGSGNNTLTIVFDGKKDSFFPFGSSEKGVVFTQDETADNKIKRMVERSKDARKILVVSDDNEIRYYTRGLGAEVKSNAEFFAKAKKKQGKVSNEKINEYDERYSRITDELKKIWIKK